MSPGVAVREKLVAAAEVTSLVGNGIYPQVAPQGCARPFVVYRVITAVPENTFTSGAGNLRRARVQVDCYADKYLDAQALAEAVESALVAANSSTFSALLESANDEYEDRAGAEGLHLARLDFGVWV